MLEVLFEIEIKDNKLVGDIKLYELRNYILKQLEHSLINLFKESWPLLK